MTIYAEEANFNFPSGIHGRLFPPEDSFYLTMSASTPQRRCRTSSAKLHRRFLAPAVVLDAGGGVKVALPRSDIDDYPGLWFRGTGGPSLRRYVSAYPLKENPEGDRNVKVIETADDIAKTTGTRTFPWRCDWHRCITTSISSLIHIVYLLAKPSAASGHFLDQARQSRVGLVERQQRLRR